MEDMARSLLDAGCPVEQIRRICRCYEAGQVGETVRALRQHRRGLMDDLHQCQERVDCLDYLLRQLEKEQKTTKQERTAT